MIDFSKTYNEENFKSFLNSFLPDDFSYNQTPIKIPKNFTIFKKAKSLGTIDSLNGLTIIELERLKPEKSRIAVTKEIFKFLELYGYKNALVITFSEKEKHYRFSLIKSELVWETETKVKKHFSNPKRLSFLLGPEAKIHTPTKQLLMLGKIKDFDDLFERFNSEIVSEEFFQNYKKLYSRLIDHIEKDKDHKSIIHKNNLSSSLFATKIMGQILFTYFIQEKKWLGANEKEKIYKGDRKYLRNIFLNISKSKNYYNEFLEYLFYDGFNTKNKDDYVKSLQTKIPFLNGGLFAPLKGYEWKNEVLNIPNIFFSNSENDGILDIFDLYNFTINETDPIDKEIGIDPEMLGKVFERLIDVDGVVYTPKIVVKNMCENLLVQYLDNNKKDLDLSTVIIKQLIKERFIDKESSLYKDLKNTFQTLDQKLKEIRIIDPAVGSGQFTTGMMSLICETREKLNIFYDYDRKMFQLKKNCIQNCIYGVDIIDSSVEITKLRLWLSLIVDEKKIENVSSLPNLDYKIYQCDSLVFSEVNIFNKNLLDKFNGLKNSLYNEDNVEKVNELKKTLTLTMDEIIKSHDDIGIEIIFNEVFSGKNPGFDIVVGNPPYVSAVDRKRSEGLKNYYKKFYPEATGSYDDFILFLLRGLSILNSNGAYSWIIKNTFLSADYSIKTKEKLINKGGLYQSLDISNEDVFHKIGVYPIIINGNFQNKSKNFQELNVGNFKNLENEIFVKVKKLKNYTTFNDFKIKLFTGTAGFSANTIIKLIETKKNDNNIPFVVSGNVDRYKYHNSNVRYMGTTYSKAYLKIKSQKILADQKVNFFQSPKIVIAGMTKEIEAVYVKKPLALGVGIFGIYEFSGYDPYFLTGLLNSKFLSNYMVNKFKDKHLAGGYISITKGVIEKLPFVLIKDSVQNYISERSKYIHDHISELDEVNNSKILELNDEINKKVEEIF